ncbi:MAG: META domain-containing protein [Sebaldella sp.]|nr:META domain-containing protein [Sebaldella sp.]
MKKVLLVIISMLLLFTISSAKTTKMKNIKNLTSTSWKLVEFQNVELVSQYIGSKSLGVITLDFSKKGSVASGNSGINTYTGSYVVNGENITFSELTSTQLYGPRNIMEQEYKYLNILPNINSFKIVDNKTLKLVTSDGVELTFTRTK